MTILERFEGPNGPRNVVRALQEQQLVGHDASVASALAAKAVLHSYKPGDIVLTEGGTDDDICFILAGLLGVEVSGREVARREPCKHIGEMTMLDVSATRCATVRALVDSVVARVPEAAFSEIAGGHP